MTQLGSEADSSSTVAEAVKTAADPLRFPVVGIGASAGGLAAALHIFEGLPAESGMAFVVILHLSPEHESHAATILQRVTKMPVIQVSQAAAIRVNHVYVIAPGTHLAMRDGQLLIDERAPRHGLPVAIDLFFRTLARAHRERAIAIVLSGTGSDGTVGLADIKAEGGIAIAQSPKDAEYGGMPSAAIASRRIDFVLDAADIPGKLLDLWHSARQIELPDPGDTFVDVKETRGKKQVAAAENALQETIAILGARTGNDFRHYKRGTVLRRLERRMQVTRQSTVPAYRDYLVAHPQEAELLQQDMLISVTSFFRDPDAFDSVRHHVNAIKLARHPMPTPVRAWIAGCATGEEAYSVAMLLNDDSPSLPNPRSVLQLFASDIDDRALLQARSGRYPAAIAADVAPELLKRYFEREGDDFVVSKALRQQILFARHNVLTDPPFSRMDLITCRNLLIYLDRDVQARVLEIFHFALNPGGLLFLGTAESAEAMPELFSIVDKKARIYRAKLVTAPRRDLLPIRMPGAPDRSVPRQTPSGPAPLTHLHQRLLEGANRASIVTDMHYNILHTSQGASRYLHHVDGMPSQNLLTILLPDLTAALMPALVYAAPPGQRVAARPVTIDGAQGAIELQMTVCRAGSEAATPLVLVLFEEIDVSLREPHPRAGASHDPGLLSLEAEIMRLRQQLEGTIDDSAESGEALRASNEELQSMNEELRSATEELETSKEELQSVNEELTTVNFELKNKVEEAAKINDDLSNLITSMNMATVFVDRSLCIRGFTPLASTIFNVLAGDVGRPLHDITHRLRYDEMSDDIAKVMATLQPVEREMSAVDGRWYLMRASAYRTNEDRIDGTVLNFIDITERRMAQEQIRARDERLRIVAESSKDFAVIALDGSGAITGWNRGAEMMFGYSEAEVQGEYFSLLFLPEDRATGVPEQELREAQADGRAVDERWHVRKDGSRFFSSGITTPIREGGVDGFAKIARDLTERQLLDKQREDVLRREQEVRRRLEQAHTTRSEFLAVMSHEMKNPLNLLLMNAELIGRTPAVAALPHLVRAVDTIRRTVHSQSMIIDDLLDLSRITTGKLTLSRGPVLAMPLIERIVAAVREETEKKNITFTLDLAHVTLFADIVRLEQIVWNLLSNAIKFTPSGGAVHLGVQANDDIAQIEVRDNGRGIDPGYISSVFNMFEQANGRSSTRRDGGLGIGLALVKNLCELHGGSVEAHSEGLDRGATFIVRLPTFKGVFSHTERNENPRVSLLEGMNICVVDDELAALEAFGALLAAEGALVQLCSSAAEALEKLGSAEFDLLISDIAMPEMSGRQLIERWRAQEPKGRRIPAVAVSGFNRPEDIELSRVAGFDAHLGKPLSLELLGSTLKELL